MTQELIVKLICVVLGIGGGLYSVYAILMSRAARSWASVKGSITSSRIEETRDREGDSRYIAQVKYTYEYRGRKYKGKRIAFGLVPWGFKWLIQSAYRDAVKNAPLTVAYVNPKKPKVSCLITGVRFFHIYNIVLFSILVLFGWFFNMKWIN